jgi:hypothetical protein
MVRLWAASSSKRGAGGMAVDWTLLFEQRENCTPTHGYEAAREVAMTAFAKSWRQE